MRQCDEQTTSARSPLQAGSHPAAGSGKHSLLRKTHGRAPVTFSLLVHTHKCIRTTAADSKGMRTPAGHRQAKPGPGHEARAANTLLPGMTRGQSSHLGTGPGFQDIPRGRQKHSFLCTPATQHQRSDRDQTPFTSPMVISAAQRPLTQGSTGLFSTINTFPASAAEPTVRCTRRFLHFPHNTASLRISAELPCSTSGDARDQALYQVHL